MPKLKPKRVSAHKYDNLSKDQKRATVVSEGYSRIEQMSCPVCGWSKVIDTKAGRIRYDKVDLENGEVLQVRYAGGRGSGFFKDQSQSKSLTQIKSDPQYADLIDQIRNQCKAILKVI